MTKHHQSKAGGWWTAHARGGFARIQRINEEILNYRGSSIWMSLADGPVPVPMPVVRRLYAGRACRAGSAPNAALPAIPQLMFGASRAAAVIGTISLRTDSPAGLQADLRCAQDIDALRRAGRRLCEIGRVSLGEDARTESIWGVLFHVAALYAKEFQGATDLLIEVHPRQAEIYRRLLGFRRASDEKKASLGRPSVLLRLELAQSTQQRRAERAADTDALNRFALETDAQQELMRRIGAVLAGTHYARASARWPVHVDNAPTDYRPSVAELDNRAVDGASPEQCSYDEGLRAGVGARLRKEPIGAYQRVGIDEFARGFRAGYFGAGSATPSGLIRGRAPR